MLLRACVKAHQLSRAALTSTASSPMLCAGLQKARENIELGDINLDMFSCIAVLGRFFQEGCYLRLVAARVWREFDNVFLRACFKVCEFSTSCTRDCSDVLGDVSFDIHSCIVVLPRGQAPGGLLQIESRQNSLPFFCGVLQGL